MNNLKHSEDFKAINQALDVLEVERLELGFWKMFAQMLLIRADKDYAQSVADQLIASVLEASKDRGLINQAHIQDAANEFRISVKKAIN